MSPRGAGRTAVWIAGLLMLGAGVLLVLGALVASGLAESANVGQLIQTGLAVEAGLIGLWVWWRRTTRPVLVTPARLAEARGALAQAVRQRWEEEARLRGLLPDPIPVPWRVTHRDGLQDRPDAITTGSLLLFDDGTDIARLVHDFRRRLIRQRLVLLGDAGAGKTSLAVLVLRELLATRGPDDPVPVLLSATTWAPRAHPDLHDWLTDRLTEEYPGLRAPELGGHAARALVVGGAVLPILDGLDELDPAVQPALLDQLNRDWATGPLILTSRTSDFATTVGHAQQVLAAALVLEPEPLTPAAIATYLASLPIAPHPGWRPILADLTDPHALTAETAALAEVADTALGLWLLRMVYFTPRLDPAGPAVLPDPAPVRACRSATALRTHLFDQLVPAAIAARPPRRSRGPADPPRPRRAYCPNDVRHWLVYLAHHLTPQATFASASEAPAQHLAWWRLAAGTGAITWPLRLVPAVLSTLVFAPMLPPFLHTAGQIVQKVRIGGRSELEAAAWGWRGLAISGIAVPWLIVAALGWVAVGRWPRHEPGYAELRPSRKPPGGMRAAAIRSVAVLGATFAITGGFAALVVDLSAYSIGVQSSAGALRSAALVVGAIGVFLIGIPIVLVSFVLTWLETPSSLHPASTPQRSWRADRTLNLSYLALGVGASLSMLVALAQIRSSATILLLPSTWAALAVPMLRGKHHAWPAYLIATGQLARNQQLPRDLMSFLDDMHRLGLLRTVGIVYQFRHDTLRRHLAAAYEREFL